VRRAGDHEVDGVAAGEAVGINGYSSG